MYVCMYVGLNLCNDIALGKKCWEDLFEPVSFFSMYRYVQILDILSQSSCLCVCNRHYMVITATAKSKEHFLKWYVTTNFMLFDVKLPLLGPVWWNPRYGS